MADAKLSSDYVIIDSPALGEYNDAYQLAAFADATLYIVKAGKTQKADVEALNSNNNIPNPLIVFAV
jgi:Mrp family chromosome partitioning ATPase